MKEPALLKPIKIKSSLGNYEVSFENPNKIYNLNNNDNENFFYLIDKNVRDIYYKNIPNKNVIELTISESIKTLSTVENIIKKLRILGANKQSTLIVLGGGISQDIGTLVASIFMRGIKGRVRSVYNSRYSLTLYELLKSYSSIVMTKDFQTINIPKLPVFTTEDGIQRIKDYFSKLGDWMNIDDLIPKNFKSKKFSNSGKAGILSGSLELVKEGNLKIKQNKLFDDLYVKENK